MIAPDLWKRLQRRIKGYRDEIVRMQRELTAVPAIGPENGGEGEYAKARYVEHKLRALSPKTLLDLPCPDPRVPQKVRPNLLALFQGESPAPTVWILSHLDVVPPGERVHWKSDPFTLRQKGDYLFGRGVEDDQQGIVSSYFAVKAFREEGILPRYPVGLAFVSDEETGSRKGLEFVLRKKGRWFNPRDLIIVPDAGDPEGTLIEVAEKSILWLKFVLTGRASHASRPDLGINTLKGTARLIVALEKLYRHFNRKDSRFDVPISTFEPTQKEANVFNVNTLPGRDVFYLDCRILPGYSLEEVLEKIRELAAEVEKKTRVQINLEVVNAAPAPEPTSDRAPVVIALQQAIEAVYRKPARPKGIGGATVAALFRKAGLPAAVWKSSLNTAHQPNEACRISRLIGDAQVFAYIFCP